MTDASLLFTVPCRSVFYYFWLKSQNDTRKKISEQQRCKHLVGTLRHSWCLRPVSCVAQVKTLAFQSFQISELWIRACGPVLYNKLVHRCFYILFHLLFINLPTILYCVVRAGDSRVQIKYIYKYVLLKSSFQGSWYEAIFITWLQTCWFVE
jgi:hypothetical protein